MKKPVKIFFGILIVIFLCVFAFSAYRLYSIQHEYKVAENKNEDIRSQFVTSVATPKPSGAPVVPLGESPIDIDFDALLAQNDQVVGWIYCEDTPINYPVARGTDNDYYLHRLIDGSYSGGGTIFFDWMCSADFSGRNTVVYGHNMNDGSMFACIRKYSTQEFYDTHPVMYFNSPTQNYRLDIFSGYITDAAADTYTVGFVSDADFQAYLDKVCSLSNFSSDVEVTASDHIVTLSTCSYEFDDARYVLHAKVVPIGGAPKTDQTGQAVQPGLPPAGTPVG